MKYGIEVEGRMRGVPTLFVDASEINTMSGLVFVLENLDDKGIRHLYVSDRDNTMDPDIVGNHATFHGIQVTLDVTALAKPVTATNITVILTMPHSFWASVNNLGADDQIKFHSINRDVLCATKRVFVPTSPAEFEGDVPL